jgi:predicted house-cleaning noncanonical NTP pyrophosphatase (MazG superfamily)
MSLPKLVRDKIPQLIESSGRSCEYEIADEGQMKTFLEAKMKEECQEFFESPSLSEAADIYEVFLAVLDNWGLEMSEVLQHSQHKKVNNGAFKNKIILQEIN